MIYLSSTTNIPDRYKWKEFGVMFSARHRIGGLDEALKQGAPWMMDNNAFTGKFDTERWVGQLLKWKQFSNTCLGIPVPDVVGDALSTLRLFSQYWRIVHDLGYPVAFVSQDGITPEVAPWDYMDVLFVGGSDEHKLGPEAGAMIAEAKRRGKWVHVGRVNSASRIKQFWMCDSVDGTWITSIRNRKNGVKRTDRFLSEIDLCASAVRWANARKNNRVNSIGQYQMEVIA